MFRAAVELGPVHDKELHQSKLVRARRPTDGMLAELAALHIAVIGLEVCHLKRAHGATVHLVVEQHVFLLLSQILQEEAYQVAAPLCNGEVYCGFALVIGAVVRTASKMLQILVQPYLLGDFFVRVLLLPP